MKLRSVALTVPAPPEEAREVAAGTLTELGWTGRWLDPWTGLAHQGNEAGSAIGGPFSAFFEIHWCVVPGPTGETVVRLEQTRNTWSGKGGALDGRRAGKRLDALVAALRARWPEAAVAEPAPALPLPA